MVKVELLPDIWHGFHKESKSHKVWIVTESNKTDIPINSFIMDSEDLDTTGQMIEAFINGEEYRPDIGKSFVYIVDDPTNPPKINSFLKQILRDRQLDKIIS